MKKFFVFCMIVFNVGQLCAQSYYYYQGEKFFVTENPYIRHVNLNKSINKETCCLIDSLLETCSWKVDVYNNHYRKYYVIQNKLECFMEILERYDSLTTLHTPNYGENDSLSFYPTRTILAK